MLQLLFCELEHEGFGKFGYDIYFNFVFDNLFLILVTMVLYLNNGNYHEG